jgi:hypothetical protein
LLWCNVHCTVSSLLHIIGFIVAVLGMIIFNHIKRQLIVKSGHECSSDKAPFILIHNSERAQSGLVPT